MRHSIQRQTCHFCGRGPLLALLLGLALGSAASPAQALKLGEATSQPAGVYLGSGFLPPAPVGMGQGSSVLFMLYLWNLQQGLGTSAAFSLNTSGTVSIGGGQRPLWFALEPPRPNPCRGAVAFGIAVPTASRVSVALYDVRGARVKVVADEVLMPGRHVRRWDGTDHQGRQVVGGVYFVRLSAPGADQLRKVVLVR
jgi:hypothetical protein